MDAPATREQAVTILWRYAGSPESGETEGLSDVSVIPGWAREAVRWADAGGILDGMMENRWFDPKTTVKRGKIASMLYHYLNQAKEETPAEMIEISFNGHTYPATLADNSLATAFAELLKNGPLTIPAHDYGGFEKVGELGTTLPRNDEQITASAGDIILYQGNQITLYYAQNITSELNGRK